MKPDSYKAASLSRGERCLPLRQVGAKQETGS